MGKILAPLKKYRIDRLGNITIPTLISSAGNSQNYVFSETDDIYFEAEIYLNSYNMVNPIIESSSAIFNITNEFSFLISDITQLGGRGVPQGAFAVYNGQRGVSLSCYYTNSATVSLNTWTKVAAERKNNNWKLFINNIELSVSRVTDASIPSNKFGNENLPVYIGKSEAGGQNFNGQIRNVILDNKLINNKTSIKKQNITVSGGVTDPNPDGIYILQDTLINGNKWYFKTFQTTPPLPPLRIINNPTTGLWAIQYLLNAWITLYASTNSANNAWEAIWPNNLQVSSGSGGKLSLKSSAIPLNILNIRVNNGPANAPWGVGGSGPCGNDFQLLNNQNGIWSQSNLSCDFFIAWDNKYGSLPYRWRFYYDSDGRVDYAEHPTAGPEALPSKGWSNGMTITAI